MKTRKARREGFDWARQLSRALVAWLIVTLAFAPLARANNPVSGSSFTGSSVVLPGQTPKPPSSSGVAWKICERPPTCFANDEARHEHARRNNCQFLEDVCQGERDNKPPPDEDRGFWGGLWDGIKGGLNYGYQFVKGLIQGLKSQVTDLWDLVSNPTEAVKGLIELGKAFYRDPGGTVRAIGELLGQELADTITRVTQCGAFDLGKVIGQNVNPVVFLRLGTRLAQFGGKLDDAVKATKRDFGCASFAGDTPVITPSGSVPIGRIDIGQLVLSRDDKTYVDKPQPVVRTFSRIAERHHRLITEFDEFNVTEEHPVWVQGMGWKPVKDVKRGDVLGAVGGDVSVLRNDRIDKPLEVFNFSVGTTPNYFVGRGLWAHNAACDLPGPLYRAPASPSGYRIGASDGGPGQWSDKDALGRQINRGDPSKPQNVYQSEITGAPHNIEYIYNGKAFDGYDAQRGVLLDAKHYQDLKFLTQPNPPSFLADAVVEDARSSSRAAAGRVVEWHVSGKLEADAVRDLLKSREIEGIVVVWTPTVGG